MKPLEDPRLWTARSPPRLHPSLGSTRAKERSLLSPILVPPGLTAAPQALTAAGQPLAAAAGALDAALPDLDATWLAAAQTLRGRQTAAALQDCRHAVTTTLRACADEVERLGQALQTSGMVYAGADAHAVGG